MSIVDQVKGIHLSNNHFNELVFPLRNWIELSKHLKHIKNLDHLLNLIKVEMDTKRRPEIVMRIYARYNNVRRSREREELLKYLIEVTPWNENDK